MLIGLFSVWCGGNVEGKEHEDDHTERLFVYQLSSSPLRTPSASVSLTSTCSAGKERMIVLHEAMRLLLRLFADPYKKDLVGRPYHRKCGGAFLHCYCTAATSLRYMTCKLLCTGSLYLDLVFAVFL